MRRRYSICSTAPDGELRIAIRQVPGVVFSTWATDELGPGSVVEVTEPTGHFTHDLDPDRARRYTFFAAGSGITPVYSMISTILATEFDSDPPFAALCVLATTLVSLPTLTILLNVLMP